MQVWREKEWTYCSMGYSSVHESYSCIHSGPWYSHELLVDSEYFVVHVLTDDQVDVGKNFGYVSGRVKDKFEGMSWELGYMGVPVLKGCRAIFGCKKITEVDAGDHTLFIGEVEYSEMDDSKTSQILDPKIYFP